MIVLISNLKPNPFRNIKKYSLNRDKVDALKQSIEETGLWKNAFCARKKEGTKNQYELVFGHHTLQAAKELGFKEVEVVIEDNLSDEVMIKRMANENMEIWGPVTSTILETVSAVKEYVENEINKYNWDELQTYSKFTICLFETKTAFTECRTKGVGLNIILKFLGKPWKEWQVRDALNIINNEKINISAVEKMNNLAEAKDTAIILNDYDVDEEDQEDIVDEIKEEIETTKEKEGKRINKKKRKEIAENIIKNKGYEKQEEEKRDYHRTKKLNESIIRKCLDSLKDLNGTLIEVLENWEYCNKDDRNKLLRQFKILFRITNKHNDKIKEIN